MTAALVTLVAGGALQAATAAAAPATRLAIVTSAWPLAQVVEGITEGQAQVVNLVPAGTNPQGYGPTSAQAKQISQADLVVDMGAGYQPAVEADAAGGHTVSLLPRLAPLSDPEFWLVPSQMEKATTIVANALVAAEPAEARSFRNGAEAYTAMLVSLDTDYQSSLSDCSRNTLVTPDKAFAAMATRYDLVDRAVGTSASPTTAAVRHAAAIMSSTQAGNAFTEPFVPGATVERAAARAHLKAKELQTMQGEPPGGWPAASLDTYYRLMESNLGLITSALHCDLGDAGQ